MTHRFLTKGLMHIMKWFDHKICKHDGIETKHGYLTNEWCTITGRIRWAGAMIAASQMSISKCVHGAGNARKRTNMRLLLKKEDLNKIRHILYLLFCCKI